AGDDGGGLDIDLANNLEGHVNINGGSFSYNHAGADGGGLELAIGGNFDGYFYVGHATFDHNTATGDDGGGLAMFVNGEPDGVTTLYCDSFSYNDAGAGGGAFFQFAYQVGFGGKLSIGYNTFDHNTASGDGGGLFLGDYGSKVDTVIHNSTFSFNSAGDDGGGAWLSSPDGTITLIQTPSDSTHAEDDGGATHTSNTPANRRVSIYNSTIAYNSTNTGTDNDGGGIFSDPDVTLTSTIFSGNTSSPGDEDL